VKRLFTTSLSLVIATLLQGIPAAEAQTRYYQNQSDVLLVAPDGAILDYTPDRRDVIVSRDSAGRRVYIDHYGNIVATEMRQNARRAQPDEYPSAPGGYRTYGNANNQRGYGYGQDEYQQGSADQGGYRDYRQYRYGEPGAVTGGIPGQVRKQPKFDSVLYIAARFSASKANHQNVVPFYLQETIGGSDIDGISSLRGFQDYRFRAPDLFVIQTQYERRLLPSPKPGSPRPSTFRSVAGALGIMAFYDTGEVANRFRDLSFSEMRHSFGFGLTFWSGERVWFRAYIGLGSGEGRHTFLGVANPSMQTPHL